jgi:HEAT repeat protein
MGIFDSFKGKRLIKALKDGDVDVRANAADALGEMGELAIEPLIEALNDLSGDVRNAAARSLGKIGDNRRTSDRISYSSIER